MFDSDKWKEIWQTITRNKWRSFMTAMGVFWGIFMFIIMSGAGMGIGSYLRGSVGQFAVNSAFITQNSTSLPYNGFKRGRWWSLTTEDIRNIKREIKEVEIAAHIFWGSWQTPTSYKGRSTNLPITGRSVEYNKIEPLKILEGRDFNEVDEIEKRKVCLLGEQVSKELFQGKSPIGEMIKNGNSFYRVIGVASPGSNNISMGINVRQSILIPSTTYQQLFNLGNKINMLGFTVDEDTDITKVEQKIKNYIYKKHYIDPKDEKAITSYNVKENFDSFNALFTGINILTWVVGLGTLFAGVIGISNIMLIVVKERTSEIGVRRAIGAKPSAIISQIMTESFVLTFIAGAAGLIVSTALLGAVDILISSNPSGFAPQVQISFNVAIIASVIVIIGGIISGIIPAFRAMSIKAVDAIREE